MATTSEQRLAALMKRVHDEGLIRHQHESESEEAYFKRLRQKAIQVQRYQRRKSRKVVRTARKRNRR